ncbi:MAG: hypothetical protein ACRC5C_12705 [Bacilli bacterium]
MNLSTKQLALLVGLCEMHVTHLTKQPIFTDEELTQLGKLDPDYSLNPVDEADQAALLTTIGKEAYHHLILLLKQQEIEQHVNQVENAFRKCTPDGNCSL